METNRKRLSKFRSISGRQVLAIVLWGTAFVVLLGLLVMMLKDGVNIKQAILPVLIGAALLVMVVFLREPAAGIYVLVALMPVLGAEFLNTRLINIAGMKLDVIIPAGVIFCILLTRQSGKMTPSDKKMTYLLMILFIITYLRGMAFALPHLSSATFTTLSGGGYLRSYLMKSFLFFVPFILIATYLNKDKQVHVLIQAIFVSVLLLGVFIIYIFIRYIGPMGSFEENKAFYTLYYNEHPNEIANFFILSLPILLGYSFHTKKLFHWVVTFINIAAILVLFSRSIYILAAVCVVVFLVNQKKYMVLFSSLILGLCALPFLPESLTKYVQTLVSGQDINVVTSGRTDDIWIPLLDEISQYSLPRLLFGYGRFGIFQTSVYQTGEIFSVIHAHNAYLNTILDAGIVGLVIVLGFLSYYLVRFYKHMRQTKNSFYSMMLWCICLSICAYLARGVSGSLLLPSSSNMFLWVNIGLGIVMLKVDTEEKGRLHATSK